LALQKVEAASTRHIDARDVWHWRFLTLKAEVLLRQGLSEESLAILNVQIPSSFQNTDLVVWQKLTQGSASAYLARFSEAANFLSQARTLAESCCKDLLGESALREGTLASLEWRLSDAQSLFHRALDISREQRDPFLEASSMGSLGLVATRAERFDESIDWGEQALQLARSQEANSLVTKIGGNLGWSYYELGDLVNALSRYQQATKDAIHAGQRHDQVIWLINTATVYYDSHDYIAAEATSQEALKLAQNLKDFDSTLSCLLNLALIAIQRGQLETASRDLDEAVHIESSAPDPQNEIYTRLVAAQLSAKKGDLSAAESSYLKIIQDPASLTSVRWEAQAGLAQAHAAEGKTDLAEREFQSAIATISNAQDSVHHEEFRLSFLSSAIRFYDQYVNFLIQRNRPLDALKIADQSRAQTLENGLTSWTVGKNGSKVPGSPKSTSSAKFRPQQIAARFRATLLFYWLGGENSHLWVISPEKTTLYSLPGSKEIDVAVASYRQAILEDPRDLLETGTDSGKKLYEILIHPAEKEIPRNSRIIILADGTLNTLNFETLPVFEPHPHYWIEDATISIASSLSLLSRTNNEPPPKSPNILLFGDPDPPTKNYPRLNDAEKEIAAVRSYFPEKKSAIFLKKDARVSTYLSSKPGGYTYLHFSTHGIASLTRPLESAIILSLEGESYKLYARDILQRPLSAYLVVISACDGAGKRNYAGEGLIGLSWAFLRAGAHNVVAGLWEVSTASTPQIMDELYKGLNEGKAPIEALRNAKLSLIHSKTRSYRRPFYWAPFQLYLGS
jgi:CHAT domain-containing protein